ncbi:inactive serine protease PAMR1-like isoform X1 [Branchiostoma floridae x Branchiostoma japonicum]
MEFAVVFLLLFRAAVGTACNPGEFSCTDGSDCVTTSWLCDGWQDCDDSSDEVQANCDAHPYNCDANQFECPNSGRCIPDVWRCDGDDDCSDNSDEQDCSGTVAPGGTGSNCNHVQEGSDSGTISLTNYQNNMDCLWTISVSAGNAIMLQFTSFSLEEDSLCEYDYVAVYDGPTVSSPLLGKFCGSTPPGPVQSSGNQIVVRFYSDYSGEYDGFEATYTAVTPSA